MYAAGKIPGSFFRREGRPSDAAILTCRLIDRPLRPSFPDGFRNEVHVVGTVLGADQDNPYDVLAINGASRRPEPLGHPLRRPDRRRAHRLHDRRRRGSPHPTYEEGDESHLRDGRRRPRARRRRRRHHDGRGRRHREGRGSYYEDGAPKVDRGGHRRGPRGLQDVDPRVHRPAARARRAGRRPQAADAPTTTQIDYTDEIYAAVEAGRRPQLGRDQQIADKAERTRRRGRRCAAEVLAELAAAVRRRRGAATPTKQLKAAFRSLTKAIVRTPHRRRGPPHRRPWPADLRPLSAEVGVLPTAHGSGLFQRGETQVLNVATLGMPKHGPDARRHRRRRPASATCTTTTSRPTPPARPASCAARSAARSATASSPSGRSCPSSRRSRSSPTRSASSPRCWLQRLHLDGLGLRLDPVADGRRRADQGARRRHRHGPRLRRRQVHDPHRHPRRRGRLRRHGLQGRRHAPSSSPPCSSTPRSTASPPTSWPRRSSRPRKPASRSSRSWPTAIAEPRAEVGDDRPEDRQLRDPDRQDRRDHRPEGQGHQRHPGRDRRRHLRRRRRHGRHRVASASPDMAQVAEAERQIRLILNPPTAEVGADLHGPGREHHQVRCVRQHPPGP